VTHRQTTDAVVSAESKLSLEYTVRTASVDAATGTAFRTVSAQLRAMEQSQNGSPIEGEALGRLIQESNAHLAAESCRVLQTDRGYLVLRPEKNRLIKMGTKDSLFAFPVPEIELRNRTNWTADTTTSPVAQKRSTLLQNDVSSLDCAVAEVDERLVRIAFRGRSEYSKWHGTQEDPAPVSAPRRLFDLVVAGHVVLDRARGCVESALWQERSVSWEGDGPVVTVYREMSWRLLPAASDAATEVPRP